MVREEVVSKAALAKQAARLLGSVSTAVKNQALLVMAEELLDRADEIVAANKIDMSKGREKGLSAALLDRLLLTESRINEMAAGLREIAMLPDPVGEIISMWKRPNGLQVGKMRVPVGVIGIIYEARPNVTVDAAGLCLKTGNAVILRGGSEAIYSNKAIAGIISEAAVRAGIPEGAIALIETTDREAVEVLLKLNEYIDILIPRGGPGLIQRVVKNATVPVIETGVGNCHVYVDNEADLEMAKRIVINSKTQRPGVCNAMETLLVHQDVAETLLPELLETMKQEYGVEIRGCPAARALVNWVKEAVEEDYYTEYLDLIMAVRIVADIDAAMDHIYKYGTRHTEAIVTTNYNKARRFVQEVDAAAVNINASTRFTDGFQYGFGAEIGISTQKLHARGPMGLTELTTTKFIVYGDGQIRK
ncbi:glutamate-5-semialdehyde dehydrogenase [Phosphitispora fastidiosa]|uniref:glutamate-5-semialdehyde dehydrogenase n=1 Tax=Phosphitispora fastidiosa TaxID=2837202 RepID=UPI001E30B474|nr:glutamate-5-semialdehyde dehydrogenase [Phosphitispora fastidiosa]MBU7005940.1 glutamate-5-semialdehyde dehydrogenase [Phosphitispora fastidiosa]